MATMIFQYGSEPSTTITYINKTSVKVENFMGRLTSLVSEREIYEVSFGVYMWSGTSPYPRCKHPMSSLTAY